MHPTSAGGTRTLQGTRVVGSGHMLLAYQCQGADGPSGVSASSTITVQHVGQLPDKRSGSSLVYDAPGVLQAKSTFVCVGGFCFFRLAETCSLQRIAEYVPGDQNVSRPWSGYSLQKRSTALELSSVLHSWISLHPRLIRAPAGGLDVFTANWAQWA